MLAGEHFCISVASMLTTVLMNRETATKTMNMNTMKLMMVTAAMKVMAMTSRLSFPHASSGLHASLREGICGNDTGSL